VPNGTDLNTWSHQRIWDGLSTTSGPITDTSVLPMRSYVQTPIRHGRVTSRNWSGFGRMTGVAAVSVR
jgi:p-hydroxybenzoate 3-monooxygenase